MKEGVFKMDIRIFALILLVISFIGLVLFYVIRLKTYKHHVIDIYDNKYKYDIDTKLVE